MIRHALQVGHERHPEAGLDKLRASVNGNMGFIFATNCSLDDIRETLKKHTRQIPLTMRCRIETSDSGPGCS